VALISAFWVDREDLSRLPRVSSLGLATTFFLGETATGFFLASFFRGLTGDDTGLLLTSFLAGTGWATGFGSGLVSTLGFASAFLGSALALISGLDLATTGSCLAALAPFLIALSAAFASRFLGDGTSSTFFDDYLLEGRSFFSTGSYFFDAASFLAGVTGTLSDFLGFSGLVKMLASSDVPTDLREVDLLGSIFTGLAGAFLSCFGLLSDLEVTLLIALGSSFLIGTSFCYIFFSWAFGWVLEASSYFFRVCAAFLGEASLLLDYSATILDLSTDFLGV